MRIAYLILAHQHPTQVSRLVAGLPDASPIFVHIDARTPAETFKEFQNALGRRPNLFFVDRYRCRWGGVGIVKAMLSAVKAAVASKIEFDYATLLSGSDYPIKSNDDIADFLTRNAGSEFIECFSMLKHNRWTDVPAKFKAPERLMRFHLSHEHRIIRFPWNRRLPYGLEPFGGAQWWTLSRPALTYVAEFAQQKPKLLRFMHGAFIPDEAMFQTILGNSPFRDRITNDELRFSIWDRPEPPYPAIITPSEFPLLQASQKHFARKFAAGDLGVYDEVDRQVRSASSPALASAS